MHVPGPSAGQTKEHPLDGTACPSRPTRCAPSSSITQRARVAILPKKSATVRLLKVYWKVSFRTKIPLQALNVLIVLFLHHSVKQKWESMMSLSQVKRTPAFNAAHSGSTLNKAKHSPGGSTAYVELKARPMSKTSLFAAYFNHMFYFSDERGVMYRLFRGIMTGRPALDIQLIHGTSDIADRRESTERALMQEVVWLAASSSEARRSGASDGSTTPFPSSRGSNLSPASPRRVSIPRSVQALQASPSFQQSVESAWAGDDRQAYEDSADVVIDTDSLAQETDALLGAVPPTSPPGTTASRPASVVPRSVNCRTLSRRMLFILLFTMCLHFFVSMLGVAMFLMHSSVQGNNSSGVRPGFRTVSDIPVGSRNANVIHVMVVFHRTVEKTSPLVDISATSGFS